MCIVFLQTIVLAKAKRLQSKDSLRSVCADDAAANIMQRKRRISSIADSSNNNNNNNNNNDKCKFQSQSMIDCHGQHLHYFTQPQQLAIWLQVERLGVRVVFLFCFVLFCFVFFFFFFFFFFPIQD
jgi:hypothetical protein